MPIAERRGSGSVQSILSSPARSRTLTRPRIDRRAADLRMLRIIRPVNTLTADFLGGFAHFRQGARCRYGDRGARKWISLWAKVGRQASARIVGRTTAHATSRGAPGRLCRPVPALPRVAARQHGQPEGGCSTVRNEGYAAGRVTRASRRVRGRAGGRPGGRVGGDDNRRRLRAQATAPGGVLRTAGRRPEEARVSSVNYFGLLATIILAGSGATWTGVESMVVA